MIAETALSGSAQFISIFTKQKGKHIQVWNRFPIHGLPLYTCINIVPFPFTCQILDHCLYKKLFLISKVARFKTCWYIKHFEKLLHLTHHLFVQTTYYRTHIHNSNLVALTKVLCFCTIYSLLCSKTVRRTKVFRKIDIPNSGRKIFSVW